MIKISLDLQKDYDEKGQVKGWIDMASINFYEKDDNQAKSIDDDGSEFIILDTPCLSFEKFDRKMSEISGEPVNEYFYSIKLNMIDVPMVEEFFKKFGVVINDE